MPQRRLKFQCDHASPLRSLRRRILLCLTLFLAPHSALFAQFKPPAPTVLWPQPAAIPFLTPLSSVQLDAVPLAGSVVTVPLVSSFNTTGITSTGQPTNGGFDQDGNTYPGELLGSSIDWLGITFPLGPANSPDAVYGATIPLPHGSFAQILLLGSLVDNVLPASGTFTLNYSDGSSTTSTQSFSDWVNPLTYSGESAAQCYPYRYSATTSPNRNSVCVYGYSIPVDSTKTATSLTLPNSSYILFLAMAMVPPQVNGTITYSPPAGTLLEPGTTTLQANFTPSDPAVASPTTATVPLTVTAPVSPIAANINWPTPQPITWPTPLSAVQLDATASVPIEPAIVPIAPKARAKIIATDGVPFISSGVDGSGREFSATQLAKALTPANSPFALLGPGIPDAVTSTTLQFPPLPGDTLFLLATAGSSAEINQPFLVTYTDGTSATTHLSLSPWTNPQSFSGETTGIKTTIADLPDGTQQTGEFNLYLYQIPIDSTRTVATLTLPNNTDVIVAAVAVGTAAATDPVSGTFIYDPTVGVVLLPGTDPLSTTFTPTQPTLFEPVTASNHILVNRPTLNVTADSFSRLYGQPNPTFTGTITGAVNGDAFQESFTTTATTLSSPGTYPIIPSATGTDLAEYQVDTVNGTLTIGKAPVTASVTASPTSFSQGQTTTLTATILSTTSGTPTGTVQFLANGSLLATQTPTAGIATLTTGLAVGTNQISIAYSGDTNFLATTSTDPTPVLVIESDFTFTAPNGSVLTAAWGSSGTITLHTQPLGPVYAAAISFTVTGIDSHLSSYSFTPTSVASAAGSTDIAFSVSLIKLASNAPHVCPTKKAIPALLAACLLFPFTRRRRARQLFILLISLITICALAACGSGYATQAIPLTVTAADGFHTHTLAVTLQIVGPK